MLSTCSVRDQVEEAARGLFWNSTLLAAVDAAVASSGIKNFNGIHLRAEHDAYVHQMGGLKARACLAACLPACPHALLLVEHPADCTAAKPRSSVFMHALGHSL